MDAAAQSGKRTRRRLDEGSSTPRSESQGSMHDAESDHPLQLRVDIESLFNDESLSDVQLVIEHNDERRRFRCHKVILASMSTYFRSLFTGGMQESQQREICLKDVDATCFEQVLRLLYGQTVNMTGDSVLTFMHLADYYGIPQLFARTEKLLETYVTVQTNNCCALLVEAAALRCARAQQHCLRILLQDFSAAAKQPAFLHLDQAALSEALAHDELACPREEVAFEALLAWWEAQQAQQKAGSLDDLLKLLKLVRWPLLSTKTLKAAKQRIPALQDNPSMAAAFCELMFECVEFQDADASGKDELRKASPRCRLRKGMPLPPLPLLEEGPWRSPTPLPPSCLLPSTLSYVWRIPHFSSLSCLSMYSPSFVINGHLWKIYVYPKGNNNQGKQLSVYLDSGITDTGESLHCTFKLAVINYRKEGTDPGLPVNIEETVVKESQHSFSKRAKDWGFREFMPLDKLEDPISGYLNEDALTIGVQLAVD